MQGQQVHAEDAGRAMETHTQFSLGNGGHEGVPAAQYRGPLLAGPVGSVQGPKGPWCRARWRGDEQ